jgi:hypothetical protein
VRAVARRSRCPPGCHGDPAGRADHPRLSQPPVRTFVTHAAVSGRTEASYAPHRAFSDPGRLVHGDRLVHVAGHAGRVDDRDVEPGVRAAPRDRERRTRADQPPGTRA